MRKSPRILYLTIVSFLLMSPVFGQGCPTESGKYWMVSFGASKPGMQPVFASSIQPDLSKIRILKDSFKDFTCALFESGLYIVPPPMTFQIDYERCDPVPKEEIAKKLAEFGNKIVELNRKAFTVKFILKDSTSVTMDFQCFSGELWVFDRAKEPMHTITPQATIPAICFGSSKYYSIKSITATGIISKTDKKKLRNIGH